MLLLLTMKTPLSTVLSIIGQGLVGVFIVLGLLAIAVLLLNLLTKNKTENN